MSADAISAFLDALRERGLEPADQIIADGALHRVRWRQDKAGTRNGAYVLHLNGHPAGFAECFKRGIRFTWSAKGARLDPAERKRFAAQMAEERKRRQQEEREQHELAAKRAQAILASARDADPEHAYLKRKGVEPHGLKVDACNRLVVPLRDPRGTIWSIQTIAPDGSKLFLKGGRKGGMFHLLGEPGDDLVIAEGFATAASIREATGLPLGIAFDAGSLVPVAKSIRGWLPLARIVIAADDDHATAGNPGLTQAHAAAELIGGNVAVPKFLDGEERGTDFNDLAALRGYEPVAEIIRAAFEEKEPEPTPGPGEPTSQQADAPPAVQLDDGDWEMPLLEAVEELNAKHFVTTTGGRTIVATLTQDEALRRELLVFSQENDIRLRYRHRHYLTGFTAKGYEIWKSLGEAWLAHRNRLNYERIALIPNGTVPPDTFNLWRGFGVDPKPGDWPLIRQHLLEVICSGNESDFRWLLGWLARAVQHPELHAEVAIVLRGLKGTGKGTLAKMLRLVFRHHAMHISNPAHFTGRFNGHLVDVLFLFVDEAFWAGDKAGEGTLKALVTEPVIAIEQKFVNAFQAVNRLKIVVASNADWVVPATHDERRYFVLDVSECRRGDSPYFTRLNQAIDGAELPAFLDHLLKLDLSNFDHRNPPHTTALNTQKLAGADSLTAFWLDCLTNGEIVGTSEFEFNGLIVGVDKAKWPEDVVAQVLHAAYITHAHNHGDRRPLSDHHMAKKLAELMPDGRLRRTRPDQPHGETARPTRYVLADLASCRSAFLAAMKIDIYCWPDDAAGPSAVAEDEASARQPQTPPSASPSASADPGNPQETTIRQPRQPRQHDSETLYRKATNPHDFEDNTKPDQPHQHANNDSSHVRLENEADEADKADGARESAAFNDGAEADGSLTEPPVRLTDQPYANGRERVGTCAHCDFTVFRDNMVETESGALLHFPCVEPWSRA
jgi:phage/plasmid primase-like uncharacterized protein/phage/plasmid-associated DNA primase